MQEKGLYSLSLLARTLAQSSATKHVKLDVVSNNIHDVSGEESCVPEKATLLAACRSIPYDYPQISCRSIDLTTEKPGAAKDGTLLDQLFAELLADTSDDVVAYRHGRRWVQTLEPMRWPLAESGTDCLRDGGVYVLAGEIEGIALELAEFVAQSAESCKLILAADSCTSDDGVAIEAEEARARRLEALRKLGAEVVVHHFDFSRAEDWQRVLANVGHIDGVIYVVSDLYRSPQETQDRDSHERLESEVNRILALEMAVGQLELDFCLLLSSGGKRERVFDAASGMFFDALAQTKNRMNKTRWMSVCLDPPPAQAESDTATTASQRVEVFERVLSGAGLAHLIVSPVDPRTRIEREDTGKNVEQEPATDTDQDERPEFKSHYVAPRNDAERTIARLWQSVLGTDRIGVHDNFFESGGHSLAGVQLIARIQESFGNNDVSLNHLFEFPTVAELAEAVTKTSNGERRLPPQLVPMQTAGSKPPFFCVHPMGGDAFGLVALARQMAPDYPFYALQSKSLVELGRSNNGVIRLEDMAAEYIEAMRALDSHGPYFVGGWSFGGTVAFEIAQQLHAQGREVALLALLDTPAPHVLAKVSYLDDAVVLVGLARERARQNGIELDLTPDDLQRLEPAEQFETILRTLKSAGLAPPELDLQYLRDFVKGFRLRLGSAIDYTPKVYPGQITLFRAGRRDQAMRQHLDNVTMETDLEDVAMGWDSLSKKPVEVYQVEGYHELIVAEPHAGLLAERLKASIDKSLAVTVCN